MNRAPLCCCSLLSCCCARWPRPAQSATSHSTGTSTVPSFSSTIYDARLVIHLKGPPPPLLLGLFLAPNACVAQPCAQLVGSKVRNALQVVQENACGLVCTRAALHGAQVAKQKAAQASNSPSMMSRWQVMHQTSTQIIILKLAPPRGQSGSLGQIVHYRH